MSLVGAHQISDSDSDATVDPNDGASSDATIDPNDGMASDSTIDPNEELEHPKTPKSSPIKKATPSSQQKVDSKSQSGKPYQFRKSYTMHDISDSESDNEIASSPVNSHENGRNKPSIMSRTSSAPVTTSASLKRSPHSSPSSKSSISKSPLEKSKSNPLSGRSKNSESRVKSSPHSSSSSKSPITKSLEKSKISPVSKKETSESNLKHPLHSSPSSKSSTSKSTLEKSHLSPTSGKRKTAESSPSEDQRPACPYGNACYRKSVTHIKNFRHVELFKDVEPASKRPRQEKSSSSWSPADVVAAAQPFSFLLTKVTGIPEKYNNTSALHITDILSPSMGKLEKSAQFNYVIDLNWLMEQYPAEFQRKPVTVVHGFQREEKRALEKEAKPYPQVTLCQAKLEIMYGTHHTKMMLLKYEEGLRVVIHTANLVEKDWYQKTQGIWVSPVFPVMSAASSSAGDSPTHFKRDLLDYIGAYHAPLLTEWLDVIKQHDLSAAKVFIIGSVPGRHTGERRTVWGHMKMRKILGQHGPSHPMVKDWPLVGQFSSIGSLGSTKESWLCGEWLASLGSCLGTAGGMKSTSTRVKLVFPSKENVRLSLEGYPAGQSIPYSHKTAFKQPYLHTFWHLWKSDSRGRSQACPHIKTYFRASPDSKRLAWFLVTSANMSKAAWGAVEKGGIQLMIRSYELGVLYLPKFFDQGEAFLTSTEESSGSESVFPLPYDLPLTPYADKDRPWLWDIPYVNLPDTHGNMWCPPL